MLDVILFLFRIFCHGEDDVFSCSREISLVVVIPQKPDPVAPPPGKVFSSLYRLARGDGFSCSSAYGTGGMMSIRE